MDFADLVKCPMCKKTPSEKDNTVCFNKCKYTFKGVRADGTKKQEGPVDTGSEGYVKMPGGSGGEGSVKWRALRITAEPR